MCGICSNLTTKTREGRQLHSSDVFVVNFEHITRIALVFPMLTLNK